MLKDRESLTPMFARRTFITGMTAGGAMLLLSPAAQAKKLGSMLGLGSILGKASDSALNKLAQPGAFYNDEDIRIGLPVVGNALGGSALGGLGGVVGSVLGQGSRLGVLDGLIRTLNDAAGTAAGEAKPIFRTAINDLSFNDVPGIVKNDTGATDYLRSSSNDRLRTKLNPLVDTALGDLGAFKQLDTLNSQHSWLASLGVDRPGLTKTVTDQGLNGIFKYIGTEERALRSDPLGKAGGLLKGMINR